MAVSLSICPLFHDYSKYEKNIAGPVFVFSETEVEDCSVLQAFVCVSIASPRVHHTKLLQQKKKKKNCT